MLKIVYSAVEILNDVFIAATKSLRTSGGGGGATKLNDLTDVNPTAQPIAGNILEGDGTDWQSVPINTALVYSNANLMPIVVGGYPIGKDFTIPQTMQQMLDGLLYPYTAPLISLNALNPAQGVREFGNTIALVALAATTTKRTDNITAVKFRRNGADIYSVPAPNPAGGVETYNDAVLVDATTTYDSQVSDGTTAVISNSRTYTFVYPYYYGVGAQGLTAAQVAGLAKSVAIKSNKAYVFNPTNQVYYMAYPASYGVLTSILDTNGFETIGDWTLRVENITGLDGLVVSYNIYEFNNLTTQINFTNTFIY